LEPIVLAQGHPSFSTGIGTWNSGEIKIKLLRSLRLGRLMKGRVFYPPPCIRAPSPSLQFLRFRKIEE